MKLSNKTKVLALVVSALMLISVFPFTASADALTLGTPTMTKDATTATITIPFTADAATAQVTLLAVRTKTATTFPTFDTDDALVAEAKYIDQKAGNTTTGSFQFKVTIADFDATKGKYLSVKIGGTAVGSPLALANNPDITVTSFLIGDVDNNGSIGSNDASWILRRVVDSGIVFPIVTAGKTDAISVGDVDNNGSIGSNDASWILRRVVDSGVVFPRH